MRHTRSRISRPGSAKEGDGYGRCGSRRSGPGSVPAAGGVPRGVPGIHRAGLAAPGAGRASRFAAGLMPARQAGSAPWPGPGTWTGRGEPRVGGPGPGPVQHLGGRRTRRAAPADAADLRTGRTAHPGRSAGGTRRYSRRDIGRLQEICALTADGLNLAGIRRVLQLQEETRQLQAEVTRLRALASDRAAPPPRAGTPRARPAASSGTEPGPRPD